jgi:hypothetical protein
VPQLFTSASQAQKAQKHAVRAGIVNCIRRKRIEPTSDVVAQLGSIIRARESAAIRGGGDPK